MARRAGPELGTPCGMIPGDVRPDDLCGCEWLRRGFGSETPAGCLASQRDGFCPVLSKNGHEPAEVKEAGPEVEVAKGEEENGL